MELDTKAMLSSLRRLCAEDKDPQNMVKLSALGDADDYVECHHLLLATGATYFENWFRTHKK